MLASFFRGLKVVSLEQAIVAPNLTYRLAQDGMRVLRIENPTRPDPDRYIGHDYLGEEGMNTYYFAINAGKKAITLNLADPRGQNILKEIMKKYRADIFITNQLPRNYHKLGIDYETLSAVKPELIWVGITGFGPEHNEAAYDPILQARGGLMEINGEEDGDPQTLGIHLSDLGASEHAYGLIMKALLQRTVTGKGCRIDLSMFESTVSWLMAQICLSHNFDYHITRRGNTHPFFAPASVFPTRDGHIYIAVGNDRQWQCLTEMPGFHSLKKQEYIRNAGRIADVDNLNRSLAEIMQTFQTLDLVELLKEARIPVSKINNIEEAIADPLIQGKMLYTEDTRSDLKLGLAPPPYMTQFLEEQGRRLSFPPRIGEHNEEIYCDMLGMSKGMFEDLQNNAII